MLDVTYSDIQSFLTCRRSWYWSYVQDFRAPEKRTGALALGTRVHKSLEFYYRGNGDPVAEHDRLAREDLEYLEEYGYEWDVEKLYEDMIVGRNCVEGHQEWLEETGEDARYEIEAVEKVISAEIIPGVRLKSKVDLLFRDKENDFLVVNDWKTHGGWGSAREKLERSWQHTTYQIVAAEQYPDEIIGGACYTVMTKMKRIKSKKSSLVERFSVPSAQRTAERRTPMLKQICADILETIERSEMEGDRHIYPTPGEHCRWCEFKAPCLLTDDSPLAAKGLLEDKFTRGKKHARYDSGG